MPSHHCYHKAVLGGYPQPPTREALMPPPVPPRFSLLIAMRGPCFVLRLLPTVSARIRRCSSRAALRTWSEARSLQSRLHHLGLQGPGADSMVKDRMPVALPMPPLQHAQESPMLDRLMIASPPPSMRMLLLALAVVPPRLAALSTSRPAHPVCLAPSLASSFREIAFEARSIAAVGMLMRRCGLLSATRMQAKQLFRLLRGYHRSLRLPSEPQLKELSASAGSVPYTQMHFEVSSPFEKCTGSTVPYPCFNFTGCQ